MPSVQIRIECDCGFQGAIRILGGYGRCFGCDTIYNERGQKLTGPPTFSSREEMMAFAANMTPSEKADKTRPRKTKAKKSAPVGPLKTDELVFSAVHFYMRKLDNWNGVLKTGREERSVRNSNVVIWCHDHIYGKVCSRKCKTI